MVKYNIKIYIGIIVIFGLAIYALISFFFEDSLKKLSLTINIAFIFYITFINLIWKSHWLFPWPVPFPNLSGKWKGEIKSNWKKEEGRIDLIPYEIEIEQSFSNIQIKLETKESSSSSIVASFDIDKWRGISRIIYTYENVPIAEVRKQSPIHIGTVVLNFKSKFDVTELKGIYYTDRYTVGDIVLKREENLK